MSLEFLAAPIHFSANKAIFASFSTNTGTSTKSSTADLRFKPLHPSIFPAKVTTPFFESINPGVPIPIAIASL